MKQYIKLLHKKYHFSEKRLTAIFQQARIEKSLVERFNHPYEAKPWHQYRSFFIKPNRINQGVEFWQHHARVLQKIEQRYGIPASVIVAIIGIETLYGKHQGSHRVFDTLTTLAFYYPARAKFFRQELTEYLLLTREQKLPTLEMTGSYAGAIGIPQFMPSTYRHYAVGYQHKNRADLIHSPHDAIISIANYLKAMGWGKKQPIAIQLPTHKVPSKLISTSAQPKLRVAKLIRQGLKSAPLKHKNRKAAVIQLETPDPATYEYWLTFANFRSIMRYNPRINYAMAVHQLSEAIKDAYQRRTHTTRPSPSSTRKNL